MNTEITQLTLATNSTVGNNETEGNKTASGSWFESMADAWGSALNDQANRIIEKSGELTDGMDSPAVITELTAESLRMSYLSNSSHTSLTSVGSALETLARKQ